MVRPTVYSRDGQIISYSCFLLSFALNSMMLIWNSVSLLRAGDTANLFSALDSGKSCVVFMPCKQISNVCDV